MFRLPTLFALFLFSVSTAICQQRTYLSIDIGNSLHTQKASPNPLFQSIRWNDPMLGIQVEQELKGRISLSIGLRAQNYRQGVQLNFDSTDYYQRPLNSLGYTEKFVFEIPLKVHFNYNLSKNVTLSPLFGYVLVPGFGYKSDPNISETGGGPDGFGNNFSYSATEQTAVPMLGLIEVGLRTRSHISERWSIGISAALRGPLQSGIGKTRMRYQFNSDVPRNVTYLHNARFFSFGVQVSYNFLRWNRS